MTTFLDIPLWDEPVTQRRDDPNMIRLADGTAQCRHCGDIIQNAVLFDINHAMVFNGWCVARLLANNGANPGQLAWLAEHGFELCDRFDTANWDLP